MKHFYIRYDLGEGIPTYDFCLKVESIAEACKEAEKILKSDYGEQFEVSNEYSCEEITAEELLKRMTLN